MKRLRHLHVVSSLSMVAASFVALSGSSSLTGCGSSSNNDSGSSVVDGNDASTPVDAATGGISISPTSAKILTCSTLQFTETGGAGGGAWSVDPTTDGTIDMTGKYTAPKVAPVTTYLDASATEPATIKYAETAGSATASIQLATAFPGAVVQLPTSDDANADQNVPFEKTFSAGGTRVYATVSGPNVDPNDYATTVAIYASNDSGRTFAAASTYTTNKLGCVTGAIDAGNPDVLYMVYYADHAMGGGSTVRLAVSEDAGKTFPKEYIVADSTNSIANFICPDVASPSADHVIVSGTVDTGAGMYVGTFISAARGANIGPVGTPGVAGKADPASASEYATSDTNHGTVHTECGIDDDGNAESARVYSNGKGGACIAYVWLGDGCPTKNGSIIQCSADNGATWTAPQAFVTDPMSHARVIPTAAISPGGNVAVAWTETVGSDDEVHLKISKDGGKTFGSPIVYPGTARAAFGGGYTGSPVPYWENDDVLWLAQTMNGSDAASMLIDKTCDFGVSWSGALHFGSNSYGNNDNYQNLGFGLTTGGMVAFGTYKHGLYSFPLAVSQ